MKLTRDQSIERGKNLKLVEGVYLNLLLAAGAQYQIWEWDKAPALLQDFCDCNGGDEDWLILTTIQAEDLPFFIERLDTGGELDEYQLKGGNLFVASHS